TLLIEMFKQVESNNEKVFLILLGEGSEVEAVKAAIKKHACQNVRIVAPVSYDNLPKWYAASNAYIHSGSEPYSTAVEFAAKAALPIITTELVGASFDYVHHNKSGYLVKYGNNDDFTNKMLYLSLNPKLALKMGQNALNIAQKRTSEWSAEQFEDAVKYVNNSLIKYVCDK
ncbi:MAG: glycosyltransferase, partial [Methylococcaceae bacterium]